jgi:phosphomannomutase
MSSAAFAPIPGHNLNPVILRAYDIRGVVGENLFTADAEAIGRVFATYTAKKTGKENPVISVAYDGRLSSPELQESLTRGMVSAGAKVVKIGVGPTPMLYFSVLENNYDAGIMVTGSHNPPTHNGFKMMIGKQALFGEEIQTLGEMSAKGDWNTATGSVEEISVIDNYVDALAKGLQPELAKKELKIVWDAGNGAAGDVMQKLTAKLPGKHILLYAEVDGNFPNHHPDPSEEHNMQDLIAKVKESGADLGVAFDGDGDRIGAVDNEGRILFGDQIMVFFAKDVLLEEKNATIIADVKASQVLFDKIAEFGGKPIVWKTGHSFIKTKMQAENAALAGEMSGHIFFKHRYYGFDDGLYGAVRLINLVAKSDESLSQMADSLPSVFNTPEIRIETTEDRKFKIIDEVKQRLKDSGTKFSDIDGVRVIGEKGWWLLRASNTQAVLVARCEAESEEELTRLKSEVSEQMKLSGIDTEI